MVKGVMTDRQHPYIPLEMHFHICLAFQWLFSCEHHSETSKQGEILHLKGQEEEFTRKVHWTHVVKCGCTN